jgi:hypothetical protein
MNEEDFERERMQVVMMFGATFGCYGTPCETCLDTSLFRAKQEPCWSCINKYGKHLEKLMRPRI